MKAYAFGYLWNVDMCDDIVEYLRKIEETMEPFGGSFAVHGGRTECLEGDLPKGDMVLIEFPDLKSAQAWYHSPAYQRIKPLRTEHANTHVLIAEGVEIGHRAMDILETAA